MNNGLMHQECERTLLLKVQQGDVKAFEHIYNIYSPRLYGSMLKVIKSGSIAEELLQDVFQRVWEHRKNINPDKSFKSYVFTIAKHLVYDYFNETSRRRLIGEYIKNLDAKSLNNCNYILEEKEAALILKEAIQQLPPQRKLVYTLCKVEGKSYEDVSKNLGISISTISDHIVKATKSIKAYYLSKDIAYQSIIVCFIFLIG